MLRSWWKEEQSSRKHRDPQLPWCGASGKSWEGRSLASDWQEEEAPAEDLVRVEHQHLYQLGDA